MKPLFPLLCFIHFSLSVYAQAPGGIYNTYPLTEKDGFPGYNYAVIYSGGSGKVYSKTYDGDIYITGNNYYIHLDKISRLQGAGGGFIEIDETEAWYFDSKHVAIIRKDTVYSLAEHEEWVDFRPKDKKLYYLSYKNGVYQPGEFDGKQFNNWTKTAALPAGMRAYFVFVTPRNELITAVCIDKKTALYKLDEKTKKTSLLAEYPLENTHIYNYTDRNNFTARLNNEINTYVDIRNGIISKRFISAAVNQAESEQLYSFFPYLLVRESDGIHTISQLNKKVTSLIHFYSKDRANLLCFNTARPAFYLSTSNNPVKVFTTLKKYPFVINNTHANALFSVRQDNEGNIWTGSYGGGISWISSKRTNIFPGIKYMITNGGSWFNGNMYLIKEDAPAGLLKIDSSGKNSIIIKGINGYSTLLSADKKYFYFGSGGYNGLWKTAASELERENPTWEKIDSSRGLTLHNILTITEDTAGRIWCGHSKRGIAVYNPKTNSAKTWLLEKGETRFGGFSSVTDKYGAVWIGSFGKGLWMYNDYTKEPSPSNCKTVSHPLLDHAKSITSLCIYNGWLVVSAYDKMLLLNIDSFHRTRKVLLRYLNPQEAGFTSFTEQNTSLTSVKDSTVWFSTSDMLYQWDLKKWLTLPEYKCRISLQITSSASKQEITEEKKLTFSPGISSFDIKIKLLSLDNLPRYLSAALVREGDSIALPAPTLENDLSLKNLGGGQYRLFIHVFESDGSIAKYEYRIVIRKFPWQQWWFWALISSLVISISLWLINLHRKKQLAEQQAKTKEAELHTLKAEQEKKIANLKLLTLSSQFRPHFILNALNTIGAKMDENPETESVLSRLGESVNLIFNHATNQKILHAFQNEWKLVFNIINIHRMMYLKKMETRLPDKEILERVQDLKVPMGLLQIPVENALLHGLSNRETGPWLLEIEIKQEKEGIRVIITDNGVGRNKSANLSNYTKHGTGTKNLIEILGIINPANKEAISFSYEDDIFKDNESYFGTRVNIYIPNNLSYEY